LILLSEDGKTLQEISSWEDIITRPGYHSKVNSKEIKLKSVIGKYRITPKQPCGISSCGSKHNKGYLVVCENGIETNIGNKCGLNIFGINFTELENRFNTDTNALRYRDKIKEYQNRYSHYEDTIHSLKNGEKQGLWCYEKMHWFMTKGFEEKTLNALKQKAKIKENGIFQLRQFDSREIELAREAGSYDTNERIRIATLSSINAVTDYKKLKPLLKDRLGKEFEVFKTLKADDREYDDLKYWNNWANRLDLRVQEAKKIIVDCTNFLNEHNITEIRKYKTHLPN
jgi:hypothetical protein